MRIPGNVAIVTGGASGLGQATVQALAGAGAMVVLCDLPGSEGPRVAAQLGDNVRFAPTDVTDEKQVARACDMALSLGPARIVVHCAGIATPGRLISRGEPLALDRIRRVIDINVIGTFNILRLAAHRMRSLDLDGEERGVVVLTGSVAAFEGQVGQAAYAASKGAVHALTLCAARDLADMAVRVATIAPGTFETPMMAGMPEQARQSLLAQVPHPNRLGRPDEFARLVMAIVDNAMLNGEIIRLDGAIRMPPR